MFFVTLFVFVVTLGVLVLVHELGHFFTAKKMGVRVEEFGFGLPPRMLGIYRDPETKKWKRVGMRRMNAPQTIYSLNWVPLGGFVKIKGEQGERGEDKDSFAHKSIGKRVLILSAGVMMNVVLTIFLFTLGYMIGMPRDIDDAQNLKFAKIKKQEIVISGVLKNSPADLAGIRAGDAVMAVDDNKFSAISDIQNYIREHAGEKIALTFSRAGMIKNTLVQPKIIEGTDRPVLGVDLSTIATVSYPWYRALPEGIKTTFSFAREILLAFWNLLKNIIISQKISVELSGPVGIAVMTGEVTKLGFIYILQFAALLSLNLAIINFMPFPALDGGRVLFLLIEKIRGKPINVKIESLIHSIGLYVLLALVVLITYKDIIRFSDRLGVLWNTILGIFVI